MAAERVRVPCCVAVFGPKPNQMLKPLILAQNLFSNVLKYISTDLSTLKYFP